MHGTGRYLKQPRHLFQLAVLLLTLAIGVQFYIYARQASGTGAITVARPPGMEFRMRLSTIDAPENTHPTVDMRRSPE